jgi:LmbE family N-acetylglucosaminyl deacetylase
MRFHLSDTISAHRPLILSELRFPSALNVLVLAPHPDDFDAIAVSLRWLHEQGHAIVVAVLTAGANGIEDGWNGLAGNEAKTAIREAEQRASCERFGLHSDRLHFLRLWEGGAPVHDAADDARLQSFVLSSNPDLVFLPHGNDSNRTHRRTFEAFASIASANRLSLLACLSQDAKTLDMRIDLRMDFGEEEAAWKAELLRQHRSQHERNLKTRGYGFDQRVLNVNRAAATAAGSAQPYTEVFELRRFG